MTPQHVVSYYVGFGTAVTEIANFSVGTSSRCMNSITIPYYTNALGFVECDPLFDFMRKLIKTNLSIFFEILRNILIEPSVI
jgi:hypothetical protein